MRDELMADGKRATWRFELEANEALLNELHAGAEAWSVTLHRRKRTYTAAGTVIAIRLFRLAAFEFFQKNRPHVEIH